MNKSKLINFLLTIILLTINIFITKWVLNTLGVIWDIELFANLDWKLYWGFGSIVSIYILMRGVETEALKASVDEIRDKSKVANEYESTYKQLVYTFGIFILLLFSWLINIIFY